MKNFFLQGRYFLRNIRSSTIV